MTQLGILITEPWMQNILALGIASNTFSDETS